MKLIVATHNQGKLAEYRSLLGEQAPALNKLDLLSLAEAGITEDVEETGTTFEANARLKAEAYAALSGLPVLADDSGLEIDALGGEPGVYSARYGGPGLTDADRCQLVLGKLAQVPPEGRTARFRCVIVVRLPDGREAVARGSIEGEIALAPVGTNGFGYDPIFFIPPKGLTMAQFSMAEKDRISHRARAFEAVLPGLQALLLS